MPSSSDESKPSDSSSSSPPPPPPDDSLSDDSSPPPPPPSDDSRDDNSSPPPPPPPSDDDNSSPSPPPPPPNHRSGSHDSDHKSSPPAITDSSSDGGADNSTAIAGAVVGGALLLLFMLCLVVLCATRRKRKARNMTYYSDSDDSYHGKRGSYFNNGQNWDPAPNKEHEVKIPPIAPQSGIASATVSSEYGWPIAPPPPPPMMSSSELSSAGFSTGSAAPPPLPTMALGLSHNSFSYEELVGATGKFSQVNLLGQGGFGYVYKGVLPNGKEIAVKCLKTNNGQVEREFHSEVDIISRVHHRHLVSLVGYCVAGTQRMLVYEFVPNGTLEFHLHGSGRPVMDWPTRLKIAIGSAKGFAYLHEDCDPRIIHRDIKAANILIDMNFEAKVADFGLAKLSQDNFTHVSTRIMGTFGYLAPEYASSGKLTEKSDVYSFGIVLLELITGRRPIDRMNTDDSLVDWARPILNDATLGRSYEELVDPHLENNYDPQEMRQLVFCAAACIRHSARRRPRMSQVVRALQGDVALEDLDAEVPPLNSRNNSEYDLQSLGKGSGSPSVAS